MDLFRNNYAKKWLAALEALPPFAGPVRIITRHDDWCDKLRGGYCNCDPEIEIQPLGGPMS